AGRLEADEVAGPLLVLADGAHHREAHWQRGIDALLARGGLDEVGTRHHRDQTGAVDVAQSAQLAGGEDDLHVGCAAGLTERAQLVVEALPVVGQGESPGDDHVYLPGPGRDRPHDLLDACRERREAGGEAGRDSGHRHFTAAERLHGHGHHVVVDANGSNCEVQVVYPELLQEIPPDRLQRLGAQPPDPACRVIAGERRQVDERDRFEQPRGLPLLLDAPPGRQCGRAALDRAAVDPGAVHPVELEVRALVARELVPGGSTGVLPGLRPDAHAPSFPGPSPSLAAISLPSSAKSLSTNRSARSAENTPSRTSGQVRSWSKLMSRCCPLASSTGTSSWPRAASTATLWKPAAITNRNSSPSMNRTPRIESAPVGW